MLGALKSLLTGQDTEYQDRLIADVWKSQPNATLGLVSRFEALLRDLGREDASSLLLQIGGIPGSVRFLDPRQVWSRLRSGLYRGCTARVPPGGCRSRAGYRARKYLAAIFELAGIQRVPADDVYVWLSGDSRDLMTFMPSFARLLTSIGYQRRDWPRKQGRSSHFGESLRRDGKTTGLLNPLPDVDVAEADWSRANNIVIDMDLVEGLVHHRSQWVQHLAALVINERLHGAARRSACERLLEAGTGDSLHWGAALTAELSDGCDLLINRLGGRDTAGLHHLFENLRDRGCRIRPSHLTVLEKALVNRGAKTAVSAARWCQDAASSDDAWIVELLRLASSYWREHEEPYPENGGTVPDSPREALLRTLCGIAPLAFEELVNLTKDPRSDVKDAAIDGVIGLAVKSCDEKSRVVENIVAKRFTSRQVEKLLDSGIPFRSEDLLILCALCRDREPAYRLIAVRRVLTHPAMDPKKGLAAAESMRGDDAGNVRDAVHQFLDQRREW